MTRSRPHGRLPRLYNLLFIFQPSQFMRCYHDRTPLQIGCIRKFLLIGVPKFPHDRVLLNLIQSFFCVCKRGFRSPLSGSRQQRFPEEYGIQGIPMKLKQDKYIIKIPHACVGSSSGKDCFQLFCQYSFQIIRSNINRAVFQHQFEAVPELSWRDCVSCGNIYLQRCYHSIKERSQADPYSRIFRLIHDL